MRQNRCTGLRSCAAGFEAAAVRMIVGLVFVAWVQASAPVQAGVTVSNCTGEPAGTSCTDTSPGDCFAALCDGAGSCVQNVPRSAGSSCTDTDPTDCFAARCDGAGICDQNFLITTNNPCTDTDGNACTDARCDASGTCDQNARNLCGECFGQPADTPCTDSDSNSCTRATCDALGNCDQDAPAPSGTLCGPLGDECRSDVCNATGQCGVSHGGPCTDTDGNACTIAACEFGGCLQSSDNAPAGAPCGPLGNECISGVCDGSHQCEVIIRVGEHCTDTDESECTIAACDGTGTCDQRDQCNTTPPDITCPPDAEVDCGESTDPSATGEATATDDCDPDPRIDYSDIVTPTSDPASPIQEVIERTWTAVDDCGNADDCEQTIEVLKLALFLDIKPGSCPNALNIRDRGTIPMSLVGTADFDVSTVDVGSLLLVRADGVGGAIAPTSSALQDTGTPFAGALCGCHRLGGDRIVDLSLKFDNLAVVSALQLNLVAPNASVQLVLSGTLSNGCKFIAGDCMVRTPVKGR